MPGATTTADLILQCARERILVGGYNGFSYADIAARVGISKPSIHHHFATKEELVRVLVSQYRAEARAGLAALDEHVRDPVERLERYVGYWQVCIADRSAPLCICALLASEVPVLPESIVLEVRAHFASLSAWLGAVLAQGAERGRLTLPKSPAAHAEAFMAAVHGAMLSARASGDAESFATVTSVVLAGLSAPRLTRRAAR